MSIPTNYLTATETQALLASGRTTVSQVIQDHKDRFVDRDPVVRAWGLPLHGVIIGVKDIINTYDMPTEHGSAIYKGSQPGVDASIVGLLRAAGAIIVGKTTTAEFAAGSRETYDTTNPFDAGRFTGASSAGSGAAVSDYQCHMALGTQTAASLMRPAGYCGIFGYKPTWGMISLDGVKSLAPTADTMGILARSVSDLKLFANALELFKKHPSQSPPKPVNQCKFAFVKTDQFGLEASQDLVNVWAKAKEVLSLTGAEVVDLDLGKEYEGWMGEEGKFTLMCRAEAGVAMKREYVIGKDKMGEGLSEWINDVNEISPQTLLQTRDDLAALRPKFDAVVSQNDAIVTFTVADTAPPIDSGGRPYLSSLWTGLHAPTVHVPGFAGEDGLPMGLTLVGARYKDQDLLEVAKVVADVWIGAGEDEGRLKRIPAPEGVVHIKP